MTDRPIVFSSLMVRALLAGRKTQTRRLSNRIIVRGDNGERSVVVPSPWQRVKPGDRLWVRERGWRSINGKGNGFYCFVGNEQHADGFPLAGHKVVPSVYMPRWASRLTLTVTATKIERLQAISEADARDEGLSHTGLADIAADEIESAAECFARLWDELHGEGAWDANPEVVVLTFTVEKRNIDASGAAA